MDLRADMGQVFASLHVSFPCTGLVRLLGFFKVTVNKRLDGLNQRRVTFAWPRPLFKRIKSLPNAQTGGTWANIIWP